MSATRKDMHQLQALARIHRMGTGAREVARLLGVSPNTERDYRRRLEAAGVLAGSPDDLPDRGKLREVVEARSLRESRNGYRSIRCRLPAQP